MTEIRYDAFGNVLEPGDVVCTITSGRHQAILRGEIIKFGKNKVKIRIGHGDRLIEIGDEVWVSNYRAMKAWRD